MPQVTLNGHGTPDPRPEAGTPRLEGMRGASNSHLLDGAPVSIGPDYKALYDAGGVTYVPALGRQAPRTRTLHYAFESARVGDRRIESRVEGVAPELVGDRVQYDRGALVEVYAARAEGLEQSFLFESLPSRAGDLVVTGHLTHNLERLPAADPRAEVRFAAGASAELRIDKVLGVDAAGRTVAGELELVGERFELRLPAAFVASAELPLVLDPMFGTELSLGPSFADSNQVDVAAPRSVDGPVSPFATVFCRYYSESDPDIHLVMGETGASSPGQLAPFVAIEANIGTWDQSPCVAYAADGNTWTVSVAWQRASSPTAGLERVLFRTYGSVAGLSDAVDLGGGVDPDIGCDDDRAVVVYDAGDSIRTRGLQVFPWANPIPGVSALTLDSASTSVPYGRPTVSAHPAQASGAAFLVAAEADYGVDRDLHLMLIDRFGVNISAPSYVTTIGPDEEYPDVATSGSEALLVFQRESAKDDGDNDVIARKYTIVPLGFGFDLVPGATETLVASDPSDDERRPAVAAASSEWVVGWLDHEFIGVYYPYYRTLKKGGCEACEPQQFFSATESLDGELELAGCLVNTLSDGVEEALVHGVHDLRAAVDEVLYNAWTDTGAGSTFATSSTGCSGSTISWSGNSSIGSSDFDVHLELDPFYIGGAVLNLASGGASIPCGACDILPVGTLFPAVIPSAGKAKTDAKLPCTVTLQGQIIRLQWVYLAHPTAPSQCATFAGLGFSPALEVTLEF